eukprot:TRINITY_DN21037_c0_g1_i1.p1 TRINITY_DN21037_c0_g1~~TRINITY_DN21037_c0_g1_i1.p1  ORF type:complete len:196 (-),score=26.87 TRINITY_DN21037_c0_g1_i1:23-556(-)
MALVAMHSRTQILPFSAAAAAFLDKLELQLCSLLDRDNDDVQTKRNDSRELRSLAQNLERMTFSSLISFSFTAAARELDSSAMTRIKDALEEFRRDIRESEIQAGNGAGLKLQLGSNSVCKASYTLTPAEWLANGAASGLRAEPQASSSKDRSATLRRSSNKITPPCTTAVERWLAD